MKDVPDQPDSKQDRLRSILIPAMLFAVAMAPLLVTPVLPLIDFYNHLARFFVLAHIQSSAFLQTYYQSHWALLPDIGVDVLGVPLLHILPPLVAGHVLVIIILGIQYGGALYFHHALTGTRSLLVAVLLLPLLYSYILNWGFANFLLGLGLAFWAAGWWIRHRDRPLLAVPVVSLFALAIFFCHGIAFAMYGILLGLLEIGFFYVKAPRSWPELVRSLGMLAAQAVIPVVYFLFWKSNLSGGGTLAAMPVATEAFVPRFLRGAYNHLESILRVAEGPSLWFDIATLFAQIAIVLFLIYRGRIGLSKPAWIMVGGLVLLALVPVPSLFGVGHIGDRTPLLAAIAFASALSVRRSGWAAADRAACAFLVAIVFLRLGAVTLHWRSYSPAYREYTEIAAQIPRQSMTMPIMMGAGNHETKIPRTEMYGSLLVIQREQAGPLFADEKQQPLLLNGRLKTAMDRLASQPTITKFEVIPDYNKYMAAAAAAGFDYLLVSNAQLLTGPLVPELTLVTRTPHFMLLRASGEARLMRPGL